MKKTKNIKIVFSFLAIVLVLIVASSSKVLSASSLNAEKRESLIKGINQINVETYALHQSRMERFEKLNTDLDSFIDEGSAKVSDDNILYLTNKTGFTSAELDSGLTGTKLEGLGKDFKEAEDEYGVNAILLMGMAKHESGNGTSSLATEKDNLFGFNAIDQDPIGAAKKFKNKGESILYVAKFLKDNYLNKDGKYFNGISTDGIGKLYATDPDWSKKVSNMMIEVSSSMLDEFERAGK